MDRFEITRLARIAGVSVGPKTIDKLDAFTSLVETSSRRDLLNLLDRSLPTHDAAPAAPTPAQIRDARQRAQLTGAEASALLHCNERSWRKWEGGDREMHPAFWELFLIKCAAAVDAPAQAGRATI